MTVNIAAQWKRDARDRNGLTAIEEQLLDQPHQQHYAVVLLETKRITRDIADGDVEVPTVNIVHIESVDGADRDQVKAMLDRIYRERTGKDTAPTLLDHLPKPDGDDTAGEGDDSAVDDDQAEPDGPVSERPRDAWLGDTFSNKA